MDWDHLRFFLELARTGKLVTAARRLEVDQATVSRRIQALEKRLGTALFLRTSSGMELSEAGQRLLPDAQVIEAAAGRVLGLSGGPGDGLAGAVRVGTTEGFGATVLAPQLGAFAARHPHLSIDLVAVSAVVSISRREADIVISLERPLRGPFVVTKLCEYVLRLYGSQTYLGRHPKLRRVADLEHHTLIGYVDDLLFSKQLQFVNEIQPRERFALRSTSVVAQLNAAAAGVGLCVLPAFLADRCPELKPVLSSQLRFHRTFWMSMPEEVKQLSRMRATWDFLRDVVARQQELLVPR
ncbi:LysR family transcriptional regulator [Pseudorhodoferax soli]|uniref:LysR family transcriptional regulator n=1 Tax=Pseudorhodoferax soli TaxID=545864 RepID=A0A368XRA4_9BURK|nr:LysR family transcriptional regulator [Pseudorhodoferax soli]RCW68544.1 LysR family transcriptional regulator [Pseudorhodoferax soli]